MLKKILFTGLFVGCSLVLPAQTTATGEQSQSQMTTDTPPEIERQYELLLSRRDININNYSNESILFDDSVYIRRLYSLPTSMELAFNPAVKAQIELYATRRKNQVSYMLGEAKYYFPIFEQSLDKEGLPLELKYLPVIESALNPVARSPKAAQGLWQFIPSTGKMFDLEINSLVDERNDPHKSSDAAAKYLKYLYDIYKDWNLVIAAYNCGPGNVNKAIRRSGGLTDYWAIYPYLPRETRGYVPIFIAATYIMNYYQEHNIQPAQPTKPLAMDSIVVNKNVHFQQISDLLNIPVEDLRKYNPQYKNDIVPGEYKGYALNLPMNRVGDFIAKQDAIYAHRANELFTHRKMAGLDVVSGSSSSSGSYVTYRVKRGDSISRIASRYGVTTTQIRQWNKLSSNTLSVGRSLRIYRPVAAKKEEVQLASNDTNKVGDTTVVSVSGLTKVVSVPKTTTSYYTIKRGDTWAGIARKNGVSMTNLKQWNGNSSKLIAGKSLKVQKTEYIQVEEKIELPEPEMPIVLIDSTYTADIIDGYLKKMVRDESTMPIVRIATTDDDEDNRSRSATNDSNIIYHKVKIGETITQIATRYNVSKKDIITWNKLRSEMAKVGQRLLIILPDQPQSNTLNNSREATAHEKILSDNKSEDK